MAGHRFFRQYSTGPYILDFYCPKLRLAIELDGPIHLKSDNQDYDQERTIYLENLDIKELRFRNEEINNNLPEVLQRISSVFPPP